MKPFLPQSHSLTGYRAHACALPVAFSQVLFSAICQVFPFRSLLSVYRILLVTMSTAGLFATAAAQPCTLPSKIYLPQSDIVRYDGYGLKLDVYEDYLVAGSPYNDSLQVDAGRVYVYKLTADNAWTKIAELFASDPAQSNSFGMNVSIYENSIAVWAREFRDDGSAVAKIYIFQKPAAAEWASSSETYIMSNSVGVQYNSFGEFHLNGDELVAVAGWDSHTEIQIYKLVGGQFTLSQTIDEPADKYGYSNYEWKLVVSDGFIAIGSEQFNNADGTSGAVFVYEKSGGVYDPEPAVLKSSLQTPTQWQGFGIGLAVHDTTIIVAGLSTTPTSYNQTLYFFERPTTGWVDEVRPPLLQHSGYVYYEVPIVVNDNYIFIADPMQQAVLGYKKTSTEWSSAEYFEMRDLPDNVYAVGADLGLTGNHLVVGCPARSMNAGFGDEMIADYYSVSGAWNAGVPYNQILHEVSVNASDDLYGISMTAHGNFLAVAASGDDAFGVNTGVVNIYDIKSSSDEPQQKVYSPEDENHTGFGNSLALGDSIMFVAAPFKDSIGADMKRVFSGIGKVYVYRLTSGGWKYHSQIIAPNVHSQTYFGQNVACSPGYVAVTEFYPGSSESVGLVHVYKENSAGKFIYIATMRPSTQLRSDFFGHSIVMNDSLMVIGTGNGSPNSSYRLRAYVFKKNGEWKSATQDAALSNSDAGWSDRFGHSVAMYGDYIVVGAPRSPGYDPRPIPRNYDITGAVYIFKRPAGGWKGSITETAKLTASDAVEQGQFGYRVAIDHDDIFVSAPYAVDMYNYSNFLTNHDGRLRPGKVYHFKKPAGGWTTTSQESRQLMSFEPEVMDGYGYELFISDRYLYVSSLYDDTPSGFRSGSVQTMMQLPVIDPIRVSCSDETLVKLEAFPARGGEWFGAGVDKSTRTFNPAVAGPGTHTLTYAVSGCSETTTAEVLVSDFDILEKSEAITVKCIDQRISLTYRSNQPASDYRWYFSVAPDDDLVPIDSMKQEIDAEKPGNYVVSVKRAVCPVRTEVFQVQDEIPVEIEIASIETFCSDKQMTLRAEPPSGTWSGTAISVDGLFDTSGLPDGNYLQRYEYVTQVGCSWRDSTLVTIDRLKEPVLIKDNDVVCGNHPVNLGLTGVDVRSTVTWFDASADAIIGTNLSLQVTHPGSYSATVSKLNCAFNTPVVTLTAETDSLFVPNVVTANSDSRNDYLEIRGEGLNDFYFSVINRYGSPVFETVDPSFQWLPENISAGVYYWIATYESCSAERKRMRGWLQIMK